MSQENDSPDSLRRVTESLSRGQVAPVKVDSVLHTRSGLALVLIIPIFLVFTITIGGYLYFTYQQIRTAIADEEYHVLSDAAEAIREELSIARFDMLTLLLDRTPGSSAGDINRESIADIMQLRRNYDFIAVLDEEGDESLRFDMVDGEVREAAAASLSGHAGQDYFQVALQQSDQQVLGTAIRMQEAQGDSSPGPVIYYALPLYNQDRSVRSVLLLVYRANRIVSVYQELAQTDVRDFWVIDFFGDILASRTGNDPFRFTANVEARDNLNVLHPEIWAALLAQPDSAVTVDSGMVSYARICSQLDCLSATGAVPRNLADGNSSMHRWRLVSLIPASLLNPVALMTAERSRWLPLTSLLLVAGAGSMFCAWLLASAMSSLRRKEARFKRANLLQDAFFEKNPEIMFVKNLDGSYYLANEKCRQLAGVPEVDFESMDREEVLSTDASSAMVEQDKQVIGNEEAMEFHTRWKREGVMYYFKTLRFPMYNQEGELIAVGGIANDVTDQVLNRQALMENERLLRTFIESAPDAVLICDDQARITLVNRQAELIFEYDREEMINKPLFDLISGLQHGEFDKALQAGRRAGEEEVFREGLEAQGIGQNQRLFPVEFSLAPINTAEGSLMICLLRDVSEKALMETQLRQSQKMEAIGKLTGGMAHDFNNLLGIIIGNIALALRQVKGDERVQKRLNTAAKAAERGAELTKRMLAVARRQPLQPKPVVINEVVEDLSQMLPQTLGSDVEMDLQLEADLPPILVDESGFEGMLLNLAINSRDAMPRGGRFVISTGVKSREDIAEVLPQTTVREKGYVHIAVSDTGSGMSEEALNRAFEPFFTTKEKGKGTGLGLAMIYGFVKQSHGYIVIDSRLGAGTTVNVYLPAGDDVGITQSELRSNKVLPLLDDRSATILVVDDEEELLEIAEAYLVDMGFQVVTAATGAEALQIVAANHRIDLLVTDVVMPGGLNGPGLAERVRQSLPDIQVIYASGFPSGVIKENAGVELDAPLVNKPYTRESLGAVVMQVLMQAEEAR